jgi:carboxyl-terminal processing protease
VLTVVYDYIQIDPIWYEMLEGENGIGYVIIENFESGAADGFISAVDDLLSQDARAFIFDVRGNGGGAVSEMTRILDYLLPEGEIFIAVDKDGKERVTTSKADFIDKPAVVLVDRYSFSAAEYFAATLGEYDYAPSVGEQTTGKNRSQTTHRMKNGGALHISSGMYLTRNRISLFDVGGLTPDHEIALSDEKFNQLLSGNLPLGEDDQLQFAISLLH